MASEISSVAISTPIYKGKNVIFILMNMRRKFTPEEIQNAQSSLLISSGMMYDGVIDFLRQLKLHSVPKGVTHNPLQRRLCGIFSPVNQHASAYRPHISREIMETMLERLTNFSRYNLDFDLPTAYTFIVDAPFFNNVPGDLTAHVRGRRPRISDESVALRLEVDSIIDGIEETQQSLEVSRKMPYEERLEVSKKPILNVPVCPNIQCQQKTRYSIENFLQHFPEDGWKINPSKIPSLKASKSGDFKHIYPFLYRDCPFCNLETSKYSYMQTQWKNAGGTTEALQKIMHRIILKLFTELKRVVIFCPKEVCPFATKGLLPSKEDCAATCMSCICCNIKICTKCNNEIVADSPHDCPTDLKTQLLIAQWLLQQCPECPVAYEKLSDCDHITCPNCTSHFCYVCGINFPHRNGIYQHIDECSRSRIQFNQENPLMEPIPRYDAWKATRTDEAIQARRVEQMEREGVRLEEQREIIRLHTVDQLERERQQLPRCQCIHCDDRRINQARIEQMRLFDHARQEIERERQQHPLCQCIHCNNRRNDEERQREFERLRLIRVEREIEIQDALRGRQLDQEGFPEYNEADFL
jgi:hypothetical protein